MIHLEILSYPDHVIVDAAPHPDPVRDEDGRVDGEVDEEVELDPRLGVAVELRREEEDAREEADGGGQVEGAPLRRAPEGLRDEGDVRAEQGHHHPQVVLLQPPADIKDYINDYLMHLMHLQTAVAFSQVDND